jgi:uncharacterized integral membrane protein
MTMDPSSLHSGEEPTGAPAPEPDSSIKGGAPRMTRASAVWVATGAGLLLLVMLIVFILQNPTQVVVHFIGLSGSLSLGMALLIAAVGGGVLVAIAGVARVTQLRMHARRVSRQNSGA